MCPLPFGLLFLLLVLRTSGQEAVLSPSSTPLGKNQNELGYELWDTPPHPDATSHVIFDAAANLLSHWGNAYHLNGHSVVPATIAPGTLLYHGRDGKVSPGAPTGAEWLTPHAEHALAFSAFSGELFTYTTTRPLKLLYFDGVSAAYLPTGTQDSQDVVIYGNVSTFHKSPYVRIRQLCEWGQQFGLDGFLRMEYDFEIMHCNFSSSSLTLVSQVDVLPCMLAPPPNWQGSMRDPMIVVYEVLSAGNWANSRALPGVKVDYSGMVSFLEGKYTSLERSRRVKRRREWRLFGISAEDVREFRREIGEVLSRPHGAEQGSGVDWEGVLRGAVQRYADKLLFLRHLVHSLERRAMGRREEEGHDVPQLVEDVRQQALILLGPYMSVSAIPASNSTEAREAWLGEVVGRCSRAYTAHLPVASFTPQEHGLFSAVEDTNHEICRTLGVIWRRTYTAESLASPLEQVRLIESWAVEIDRLIGWLDWAVFRRCDPECGRDEECSLLQWPFDGVKEGTEEIVARCVSKLHYKPLTERVASADSRFL